MRRSRLLLMTACAVVGFLLALAVQVRPANPESRLPRRYRLADLVRAQEEAAGRLRRDVEQLRGRVDALVGSAAQRQAGAAGLQAAVDDAELRAGLVALRGPGFRVTLDDSLLEEAPSGNVNDLVIHSQDVQAVVNALWRAGAEAIDINGQRLVGTSAVLCVGNTLLLNGTVHSPPYVTTALGASRSRFDDDPLVQRLRREAEDFGIRVSVDRSDEVEVPAYRGSTGVDLARPLSER